MFIVSEQTEIVSDAEAYCQHEADSYSSETAHCSLRCEAEQAVIEFRSNTHSMCIMQYGMHSNTKLLPLVHHRRVPLPQQL
jgi:hypothetical protein